MGAWGVGPFENDAAADFLNSFRGITLAQAQEQLEKALQTPDDYFEFDAGDEQVAAIAIVAALVQYLKSQSLSNELENLNWVTQVTLDLLEQWREQALLALEKLREDDNELLQLWEESGEKDNWLAELDKLQEKVTF